MKLIFMVCLIIVKAIGISSHQEYKEFNSTNDDNDSEIHISYLELEDVYRIEDNYIFCIPEVSIVCECTCTTKDEEYCSHHSGHDELRCATFANFTTTCTNYDSFGKDSNVCSHYYRICCQTYFSRNIILRNYIAFKLKYHKSKYNFRVNFKSSYGKSSFIYTIDKTIKYLSLTPDFILRMTFMNSVQFLSNKLFFVEEGANDLLFSEYVNEKNEENLDKIGWFHLNGQSNHPSRVRLNDLKKRLQVNPLDCDPNSPRINWKLNANGYSSKGIIMRLPNDVRRVSEMHKDLISHTSVKLQEKEVSFELLNPAIINISIANTTSFSFIFICKIFMTDKKNPTLNLKFLKGNSTFNVKIKDHYLSEIYKFTIAIKNSSLDEPSNITKLIPLHNYTSSILCVYQNDEQLCQYPEVITFETNEGKLSNENTTFLPNSYTESKSVTLDKNNEYVLRENSLNNLHIIIINIGILFLLLISTFLIYRRVSRKYRKKRYSGEPVESEDMNLVNTDIENNYERKTMDENTNLINNIKNEVHDKTFSGQRMENVMHKISRRLSKNDHKVLAKLLDVSEETVNKIIKTCTENEYETEAIAYEVIKAWKEANGAKAVMNGLIAALSSMKKDIVDEILDGVYLEMHTEQKKKFRSMQLDGYFENMGPLEQIYEITVINENQSEEQKSRRINKTEIFKGLENITNPRLIFVEDEQYSQEGDTILAQKFLGDWSKGAKYISDKFYLVFFISLKNVYENDIKKYIFEECMGIEETEKVLLSKFENLRERVLILVNGLDEATDEVMESLRPILIGEEFPYVTVAVVSRTEDIYLDRNYDELKYLESKTVINWSRQFHFKSKSIF